ncbi:hypothetical protein ACJJIL_12565 [Microbulbifer sp. EKSA005]|uniref:hypothetical protein n=1 Tax=Microbulbifer sp. EKSA005 TaxID=3243364 RepID=UPI0040423FE6
MEFKNSDLKHQGMRSPDLADTRRVHGQQISPTWTNERTATYWMKRKLMALKVKPFMGTVRRLLILCLGALVPVKG